MRLVAIILASAVAFAGGAVCSIAAPRPAADADARFNGFRATIAYSVDGDTLRVREFDRELTYVRLVGIDTPEDVKPGYSTECGAEAAAPSMERLAPEGAEVTLRYDSVADHEDVYGRTLAHAYVDGGQLEAFQLRRGLSYVYDYDDQAFDDCARFYAIEAKARDERRGSWEVCGGDFHSAEPGVQN